MVGSFSSVSSGPSPSTSSSTSSTILVCSAVVIGTRSSSSSRSTTRPISARTRSFGMEETRSRFRTPISLRWICDFSSKYRSAPRAPWTALRRARVEDDCSIPRCLLELLFVRVCANNYIPRQISR